MKNYRVFLWPGPDGRLDIVGLSREIASPATRENFENVEGMWLSGTGAPEALVRDFEALLPPSSAIHVFATPDLSLAQRTSLQLGPKKLLAISESSGLKDYAWIKEFLAKPPLSEDAAREILQRACASFSDREVELRLRRFGDLAVLRDSFKNDLDRYTRLWAKSRRPQRLLLHVCCGPDAAGVVDQLKSEFDLTCFWYDPNIQPRQEHDKRVAAFEKVMRLENVPYRIGEYDVDTFLERIQGLEHTPEQGAKCSKCYDLRLERAALEAKEGGFDLYATTLAISPHKVQQKLISFGELNERRYGVPYFHRNFMKHDGFRDSVEYTRAHDIYRQDYCGCWFSLHEGGRAAQWLASQLGLEASSRTAPSDISDDVFREYEAKLDAHSDYRGG